MRIKTIAKIVIPGVVVLFLLVTAYTLGENHGKKHKPFGPVDCLTFYLEIYNKCLDNVSPFKFDCPSGFPPLLCCAQATIAFFCHDFANPEATDYYYLHTESFYLRD